MLNQSIQLNISKFFTIFFVICYSFAFVSIAYAGISLLAKTIFYFILIIHAVFHSRYVFFCSRIANIQMSSNRNYMLTQKNGQVLGFLCLVNFILNDLFLILILRPIFEPQSCSNIPKKIYSWLKRNKTYLVIFRDQIKDEEYRRFCLWLRYYQKDR